MNGQSGFSDRVFSSDGGVETFRIGGVAKLSDAAFSPDGSRIIVVTGAPGGDTATTARIFCAETGGEICRLLGHANVVRAAAFSPDGRHVATASEDGSARIWSADDGREVLQMQGHGESVHSILFSPDGARVVTASLDKTVRIWNARTGEELVCMPAAPDAGDIDVSPDGARILTVENTFLGARTFTAKVWDAATGAEITRLVGHTGSLTTAVFCPDGVRVLTASMDQSARVWDVAPTVAVARGAGVVLAAALSSGVGLRRADERGDLLMQDAPDDLCAALMALMPDCELAVAAASSELRAPLHPHCYMSATAFAALCRFEPDSGRQFASDVSATTQPSASVDTTPALAASPVDLEQAAPLAAERPSVGRPPGPRGAARFIIVLAVGAILFAASVIAWRFGAPGLLP